MNDEVLRAASCGDSEAVERFYRTNSINILRHACIVIILKRIIFSSKPSLNTRHATLRTA